MSYKNSVCGNVLRCSNIKCDVRRVWLSRLQMLVMLKQQKEGISLLQEVKEDDETLNQVGRMVVILILMLSS